MPRDRFDREIDYLRISLTDRCNLRCIYCMPETGTAHAEPSDALGCDEIERIVVAAAGIGFRKVRLTGGEPTLRPDLLEIVERIARVPGIDDVAMTTNGILLPGLATALRRAGLRRVNVHLDSLDPERVARVMRRGTLERILAGIEAAERAGFHPVKVNTVVVAGENDGDVVDLARLTVERDWHVRFIELMPLGGGECARIATTRYVSNFGTRARIEAALGPLEPVASSHPSDEARNFRLAGARGVVGFISPVSEPFCGTCNRMRLTSDGRFHLCLLKDDEQDVIGALRQGADAARLGEILRNAVLAKPTGHALDVGVSTTVRSMHHLGG
ncbi:GTP 3',8-cyclase MoaA [bacterium]|nr:GTP 3',8-cyclase MoaA [bacterium]